MRNPIRKGVKNKIAIGEIPILFKIWGIIKRIPEFSRILLNIITETIRRIIFQDNKIFLRTKVTLFLFILVVIKVKNTISDKDKTRSNLNMNTRTTMLKIGQL